MITHDLILVGGGHTHVLLIRALAMRPIPGVRVTLVSEKTQIPYSGMLPGYVAGHYSLQQTNIDLNRLCRRANVRWIKAVVKAIDTGLKQVHLRDQPSVGFDKLSIDIGSTPDLSIKGAAEFATGVKPIAGFQKRWLSLLDRTDPEPESAGAELRQRDWGVIGAGAGGIELVLAMAYRMRHSKSVRFHLVYRGDQVLEEYPAKVRSIVEQHLKNYGVVLHPNFPVTEVMQNGISGNSGQQLELDESIWCTGAKGAAWLADSLLDLTNKNFIEVNRSLQSISHDSVFAAGDIAEIVEDPRPKAGVYAVRQAPQLEENLRRAFSGQALQEFKLQKQFLSLLSLGEQKAVASRNGLVASGAWVWRWKNHIDQKFMHQFANFKMPAISGQMDNRSTMGDETMVCGGCGSKLGPELLAGNLQQIDRLNYPELATTSAALKLDDAFVWNPTPGTSTVQSIDGFRNFISDENLFARISVNHALSDIHAMGGQVTHAQAWINLAFSHPRIQQREHLRMLHGVVTAMREHEAVLTGGHSTEGAETHMAIVANGELNRGSQWSKTGVHAGDILVLSKSLGTGVVLAADMQGEAPAEAVEAACLSMLKSNQYAMSQLRAHSPHAVTDVTGFGLLGHLLEMLGTAAVGSQQRLTELNLGAVLDLSSIPLVAGALELVRAGWQSSLYPGLQPYLAYCELDGLSAGSDQDMLKLLLDPQTSGGLLASLSKDQAELLLSANTEFVAIGSIETRPGPAMIRF